MPTETLWERDTVMWKSEIGSVVKDDLGEKHKPILDEARRHFYNEGGLEKSALFIAHFLENAWSQGLRSTSLDRLCDLILEFAEDPFK